MILVYRYRCAGRARQVLREPKNSKCLKKGPQRGYRWFGISLEAGAIISTQSCITMQAMMKFSKALEVIILQTTQYADDIWTLHGLSRLSSL